MLPGDLVLLATDGVLDNMFENQILQVLHQVLDPATIRDLDEKALSKCIQTLADRIGSESQIGGNDTEWISPFAENAKNAGYRYKGGKTDDITVVTAIVV